MASIDYSVLDPKELEVIHYVLRKSAKGRPGILRRDTARLEDGFCGPFLRDVARILPDYMVRDFHGRNIRPVSLPVEALPGPGWQFQKREEWDEMQTELLGVPERLDSWIPSAPTYSVSRPAIWWDRRAALIFIQWIGGIGGIQSDYILLNYNYRLEQWHRLRRMVAGTT